MKFPHDVSGWLSEKEGIALNTWSANRCVLEIGSYKGRSTICIAQSAKMVVCIDPFTSLNTPGKDRDTFEEFKKNLQKHDIKNVTHYRGTTDQIAPLLEGKYAFDVVFIDGDHSYEMVMNDTQWAKRLLVKDGLILYHDYRCGSNQEGFDPGVEKAVNELVAMGNIRIADRQDSLAVCW